MPVAPENQLWMLQPGYSTETDEADLAVLVADDVLSERGGVVINPLSAIDQGAIAPTPQVLYINLVSAPLGNLSIPGTIELQPGQWFLIPPKSNVWVASAYARHKFTAFFSTSYKVPPAIPVPGDPASDVPSVVAEPGTQPYPPGHVTGLVDVIPSYLYQQYTDDDDLQGFVEAQNQMQQNYVDTFNGLNLPIYTNYPVSGKLLDWVARGVYGISRPTLGSGRMGLMGPLNTYGCNWLVPMWDFPQLTFNQGNWSVAANDPDISPNVIDPFDGFYWNAITANPTVPETAPASLPGIGGKLITQGDKILWDDRQKIYVQTVNAAVEANFGYNMIGLYGPMNVYLTSDDLYRRIITWHFFKQDGNYCSVEYIKRRIWRFLYGTDGKHWDFVDPTIGAPHPADTWPGSLADPDDAFIADTRQISITFGVHRNAHIRFVMGKRTVTGGGIINWVGCNGIEPAFGIFIPGPPPAPFGAWDIGTDTTPMPTGIVPPGGIYINDLETTYERYDPLPYMHEFKQALDLGVIELPYQFNWTCSIG